MPRKTMAGIAFILTLGICAGAQDDKLVVDFAQKGIEKQIRGNAPNNTKEGAEFIISDGAKGKVLDVKCIPNSLHVYPGVSIDFDPPLDFSKFGRIEVDLTNYSQEEIIFCLRVDNAGYWQTEPWNTEQKIIQPGRSGTVAVHFGYSWGKPGFKLDPSKIVSLMLFVSKPKTERFFRIERIRATGKPGDKP